MTPTVAGALTERLARSTRAPPGSATPPLPLVAPTSDAMVPTLVFASLLQHDQKHLSTNTSPHMAQVYFGSMVGISALQHRHLSECLPPPGVSALALRSLRGIRRAR